MEGKYECHDQSLTLGGHLPHHTELLSTAELRENDEDSTNHPPVSLTLLNLTNNFLQTISFSCICCCIAICIQGKNILQLYV
jgi:hypothetical protein